MQRADLRILYIQKTIGYRIVSSDNVEKLGEKVNLEISNISATGVQFVTENQVVEGGNLLIELPLENEIFKIECQLVRVSIELGKYFCGAQFIIKEHDNEAKLRRYIFQMQIKKCRD